MSVVFSIFLWKVVDELLKIKLLLDIQSPPRGILYCGGRMCTLGQPLNRRRFYTKLLLTMHRVETYDEKCGTTYQLLIYSYFSLAKF